MTAQQPSSAPRVLVVVRDPALRRSTWTELEKTGVRVEFCTDEFDALSLVESHGDAYDVAIVDGDFRHLTGAEIADRVTHINSRMRVIVCSDRPGVLSRKTTVGRLAMSSVPAHLIETVRRALVRQAVVERHTPRA